MVSFWYGQDVCFDVQFLKTDIRYVFGENYLSHTLLVIWFLPGMVGKVYLSAIATFAIWFLSGMDKMFALMCSF